MKKIIKNVITFVLIFTTITLTFFVIKNYVEKYRKFKVEIQEQEKEKSNIYIDKYNFEQLDKAKVILDNKPKDIYPLYGLNEFNKKYNIDIKPIKNCYYVSNGNKGDNFIFGFQLESEKYRKLYRKNYYVYPKYDLKIEPLCIMGGGCTENISYVRFLETIFIGNRREFFTSTKRNDLFHFF